MARNKPYKKIKGGKCSLLQYSLNASMSKTAYYLLCMQFRLILRQNMEIYMLTMY